MVILLSDYSPKITGTLKVSTSPAGTLAVSGNTMSGSLSADHVTYSNGTKDYEELDHKPSINGHVVEGDKLSADYDIDNNPISNTDILSIIMR